MRPTYIIYIFALKKPISNESHLSGSVPISNNLMLIYAVTKSSDSSFLLSHFNLQSIYRPSDQTFGPHPLKFC